MCKKQQDLPIISEIDQDLRFLHTTPAPPPPTSLLLTIETSTTTTTAATRSLTKHEQTMFITITPITPSLSLSTVEPARFNEPLYNERLSSARPKLLNRVVSYTLL